MIEGSPSVPQQPVERFGDRAVRWTLLACPECGRDNTTCLDRALVYHWRDCAYGKRSQSSGEHVEVVPALVAERLAEALRWMADANLAEEADAYDWAVEAYDKARAALAEFESGGATKPGEET